MHCAHKDQFCFVCGFFTDANHRHSLSSSPKVIFAYEHFFQLKYTEKDYAPSIVCESCSRRLRGWRMLEKQHKCLPLLFPMRWIPLTPHVADRCYFCLNIARGLHFDIRKKVNIVPGENALMSVERTPEDPVPVPPALHSTQRFSELDRDEEYAEAGVFETTAEELITPSTSGEVSHRTSKSSTHSLYLPPGVHSIEKHAITEKDFDDLCRDFRIPLYLSEDLLSRFKDWNLMEPGVTIAHVRNRHHEMDRFFAEYNKLIYCCDIEGLFERFGHPHHPNEWTLFIDSSRQSKLFYCSISRLQ